jgi:flagellar motor switch protein FliM
MADVLSQSEIDALLSALSTGELESEEIGKEDDKHNLFMIIMRELFLIT